MHGEKLLETFFFKFKMGTDTISEKPFEIESATGISNIFGKILEIDAEIEIPRTIQIAGPQTPKSSKQASARPDGQ